MSNVPPTLESMARDLLDRSQLTIRRVWALVVDSQVPLDETDIVEAVECRVLADHGPEIAQAGSAPREALDAIVLHLVAY